MYEIQSRFQGSTHPWVTKCHANDLRSAFSGMATEAEAMPSHDHRVIKTSYVQVVKLEALEELGPIEWMATEDYIHAGDSNG